MNASFELSSHLKRIIFDASLLEFKSALPSLSYSEWVECLNAFSLQNPAEAKEKIETFILFIDQSKGWEKLAVQLSTSNFINTLEFLNSYPHYQNRLHFILTGLSPAIFYQSLTLLAPSHLLILKQNPLLEPLQYHLIQFIHEGQALEQKIEQSSQLFIKQVQSINPGTLTKEAMQSLMDQINFLRAMLLDYLKHLNIVLSIVWHTDRIDLIEKLSSLNESLHYQLSHLLGHSATNEETSTGLYLKTEEILSAIFDSNLKNEDAAIEGLTRLSIWHLKDYSELGLLPTNLILEESSNKIETPDYSQHFFAFVQKQLEYLHLITIRDLKKNHLFSKFLLKDYIENNKHLLDKIL